jgi:hypothetical protein
VNANDKHPKKNKKESGCGPCDYTKKRRGPLSAVELTVVMLANVAMVVVFGIAMVGSSAIFSLEPASHIQFILPRLLITFLVVTTLMTFAAWIRYNVMGYSLIQYTDDGGYRHQHADCFFEFMRADPERKGLQLRVGGYGRKSYVVKRGYYPAYWHVSSWDGRIKCWDGRREVILQSGHYQMVTSPEKAEVIVNEYQSLSEMMAQGQEDAKALLSAGVHLLSIINLTFQGRDTQRSVSAMRLRRKLVALYTEMEIKSPKLFKGLKEKHLCIELLGRWDSELKAYGEDMAAAQRQVAAEAAGGGRYWGPDGD